jgi:hypothetical protein
MAKPSPPPRPQLRAGDVVVLRQGALADGIRLSESGDDSHHGGGAQEVRFELYPEPPSFQVKSVMLIR